MPGAVQGFFQIIRGSKLEELEDLLLKRYGGNIGYVLKLPLNRAIRLIELAREEETRESLFRIYLAGYPNYTKDTYETFDQFYDKCRPKVVQIDTRSKAEIMSEIKAIEDKFKTTE